MEVVLLSASINGVSISTRVWLGYGYSTEIVIGSLSIVAQIAGMSISISLADSGPGIWSGIFVIILIQLILNRIKDLNPFADIWDTPGVFILTKISKFHRVFTD